MRRIAADLGRVVGELHALPVPAGDVLDPGWSDWSRFVAARRDGIEARHRAWGTLPQRLIAQIGDYVARYDVPEDDEPVLVHADLHHDHLFGHEDAAGRWRLQGVIDWGDARVGDRLYELPAVHLGSFHGDRRRLRAFLDAAAWPGGRSPAFAQRAMMVTLLHEFNVLDEIASIVDLEAIAILDQLAERLWRADT